MSLRNRARALQKKTGLSYQQALDKLRTLGDRPATLSKQTGWALEKCDRYLIDGHAPIDVIEMVQPDDPIMVVCNRLLAQTMARAVVVASDDGRILGHTGNDPEGLWVGTLPRGPRKVEVPDVWELDSGLVLVTERFKRGMLIVKFHRDESSLGLVRLRMRQAVEELERLLAGESKSPGVPPVGGGGGPGGLPAEVRVVRDTRDPPPPPKKKPIGKRKKR